MKWLVMLFQVCIKSAVDCERSKQECFFERNCPSKEDGGSLEGNGRKEGWRWRAWRDPGRTPGKREDRQPSFNVTILCKVTCLGFMELHSPASRERFCSIWFLLCLRACAILEILTLPPSRFSRMYIFNTVEDLLGSFCSLAFQFQLMSGKLRIFHIHVSVV